MPKRAATTRSRVQRNRPKVQKPFELVRSEKVEEESDASIVEEEGGIASGEEEGGTSSGEEEGDTSLARVSTVNGRGSGSPLREKGAASPLREKGKNSSLRGGGSVSPLQEDAPGKVEERQSTSAPGSASARLAARRLAAQRLQQRSAATLITSEHFAYVRRDLIKIGVFAVLMFTAIVVLYLTLGRV